MNAKRKCVLLFSTLNYHLNEEFQVFPSVCDGFSN